MTMQLPGMDSFCGDVFLLEYPEMGAALRKKGERKGFVLRIGSALLVLRTACGGLCRKTRGEKRQHHSLF